MVGAGFATYAKCLFSQSPFLPTSSRCLLPPLPLYVCLFSPLFSVWQLPGGGKERMGKALSPDRREKVKKFYLQFLGLFTKSCSVRYDFLHHFEWSHRRQEGGKKPFSNIRAKKIFFHGMKITLRMSELYAAVPFCWSD